MRRWLLVAVAAGITIMPDHPIAAAPSTASFLATLVPALATATTDAKVDAVLATHPSDVRIESTATGWSLAFPAVDVKPLIAAWHWTGVFAVSGDVHQRFFGIRRSTGAIAPDRIGTVDPTAGVWAVRVTLTARPDGALPALSAGASPAYDLSKYPAAVDRIEITRAPRATADTLARLHALTGAIDMAAIESILGRPDGDIGSGIHIFRYDLDDGSSIKVGTPDLKRVLYIRRLQAGQPDAVLYQSP